jgi:hypothetical protein
VSLILKGGCHCGAVRFEALWGDRARLAQKCNCSICSKSGFIHAIVPDRDFKLLSGHENLSSYKFNTNVADHVFCKICGIKSFYRPRSNPDGWSINLNCVENADALGFEIEPFDGINWESHAHTLAHLI